MPNNTKTEDIDATERQLYVCPDTHAPLENMNDELVSPSTGRHFTVLNGPIPCFLRYEPIEQDKTAEELEHLNDLASAVGWRKALEKVHGNDEVKLRYDTDETRHCYDELLPLASDSRVLEIGTGLGNNTAILMKRVRAVHGIEVVPGQARFVLQRCAQEGGRNVFLACGGDDGRLPYAAGSFDVVIMNLVFEWVGSRERDKWPEGIQQQFLDEILRVLAPGGTLYLSTKNRYALRHFKPGPDVHSGGVLFANILPRWLFRRRLARKGLKSPPGLLHSYRALERMLLNTGFSEAEPLWAVPDMRWPGKFVKADMESIRKAQREDDLWPENSLSSRLIRSAPPRLVKHIAPGLAFLARKRG